MTFKLRELCIEITNQCYMNCVHCSNKNTSNDEIKFSDIKIIVNEFVELGGELLEISGGEPLLHPNLLDLIAYAKKSNLDTILYTSGLISKNCDIDLRQIREAGLYKIIFNIQGATPDVHERITGINGSFEKAKKGISEAKKAGFWVGVHFVPMKLNFQEIEKTIQLCSDLDVDEFAVLRLVPQGRARSNLNEIEFKDYWNLICKLDDLENMFLGKPYIRVGCPLDYRFLINDSYPIECHAGKTSCLIKPDGDVIPCPAFKQNKGYVGGNIRYHSLEDIWNNSWKELREFDYRKLSKPCGICEYVSLCRGRCAAQRIINKGNLYSPDIFCPKINMPHHLKDGIAPIKYKKPKKTIITPAITRA